MYYSVCNSNWGDSMTYSRHLLEEWGLEKSVREIRKTHLRYTYDLGNMDFIFLKEGEHTFLDIHSALWCENETEIFVAISENGDIHICDSKTKPTRERSIENAAIDSFNYKKKAPKARKFLRLFRKKNIDSGKCMNEMQKLLRKRRKRKRRKRKKMRITIEEDLITTMELCTERISSLLDKEEKEIAHNIVDRCLLIRFLEDKTDRDDLRNVLRHKNLNDLLDLFDSYSKVLAFEKDMPRNISSKIMEILEVFGPAGMYNFKDTPVMVISSVFENLLSRREHKQVIPKNVAEYIADNLLDSCPVDKMRENEIRILDPACNTGIFLITFLEKIIERKEENGVRLSLEEKIQILNCLHGIDKSSHALGIAAVCLYLKTVEGERPVVNTFFEDNFVKAVAHLRQGNPLDDNVFWDEPFDIIAGNLLQVSSLKERTVKDQLENEWPSSDCSQFLLDMKKWMEPKTMCGIVAPLSYFTRKKFEKFRKDFLDVYGLKSFTNLSRIKDITTQQEVCILFFDTTSETVEFCTPELTYFSLLTGVISEDNKADVAIAILHENDHLWPVYALGCHSYVEVIDILDRSSCGRFEDFFVQEKCLKLVREEHSRIYRASSKSIEALNNNLPFEKEEPELLEKYTIHIENGDLKGKKLFVTKTWPIKTVIASDVSDDANFLIYELRRDYPAQYLLLFETILNSTLAKFYFEVKYYLGESCYPVNVQHLDQFPIPDLKQSQCIDELVEAALLLKCIDPSDSYYTTLENKRDALVFTLYDLDYYDIKKIEHYYLENRNVREEDIQKYCEEVIDTFQSFIKEGYVLNPEWATSEFFGTLVRFSASEDDIPLQYNKELEQFMRIIGRKFERKDIFKEKKIRFYRNNDLYFYKSNKLKDWTEFMAIKDANEELHLLLQKLEG